MNIVFIVEHVIEVVKVILFKLEVGIIKVIVPGIIVIVYYDRMMVNNVILMVEDCINIVLVLHFAISKQVDYTFIVYFKVETNMVVGMIKEKVLIIVSEVVLIDQRSIEVIQVDEDLVFVVI